MRNIATAGHFGKTDFQKIEELVSTENMKTILDSVDVGDLNKSQVEKFLQCLNPSVRGTFIRAQREVNYVFDQSMMETLLADWYDKEAYGLTKDCTNQST